MMAQFVGLGVVRIASRISEGVMPPKARVRELVDTKGNWAFLMTAAKIPLAVLFVFLVELRDVKAASAVMAFAVGLDIFDGIVFGTSRAARSPSLCRARRVLDALSDRILIALAVLSSLHAGLLAWQIAAAILLREISVISITTFRFVRLGRIMRPNMAARISTTAGAILGIAAIGGVGNVASLAAYLLISSVGIWLYLWKPRYI